MNYKIVLKNGLSIPCTDVIENGERVTGMISKRDDENELYLLKQSEVMFIHVLGVTDKEFDTITAQAEKIDSMYAECDLEGCDCVAPEEKEDEIPEGYLEFSQLDSKDRMYV